MMIQIKEILILEIESEIITLPILTQENPKLSQHLIQMSEETNLLFKAFSDLTSQLDIQDCQIFRSQSEGNTVLLLQNYLRKFPNLGSQQSSI